MYDLPKNPDEAIHFAAVATVHAILINNLFQPYKYVREEIDEAFRPTEYADTTLSLYYRRGRKIYCYYYY